MDEAAGWNIEAKKDYTNEISTKEETKLRKNSVMKTVKPTSTRRMSEIFEWEWDFLRVSKVVNANKDRFSQK